MIKSKLGSVKKKETYLTNIPLSSTWKNRCWNNRVILLVIGYYIKPENSECNKSIFHAIVKAQKFSTFCGPNYYWAVFKNRYFRPWVKSDHVLLWLIFTLFHSFPDTKGLSQPVLLKVERLQEEVLQCLQYQAKGTHPLCTLRVLKLLLRLCAIHRISLELRNHAFYSSFLGRIFYIFVPIQIVWQCTCSTSRPVLEKYCPFWPHSQREGEAPLCSYTSSLNSFGWSPD